MKKSIAILPETCAYRLVYVEQIEMAGPAYVPIYRNLTTLHKVWPIFRKKTKKAWAPGPPIEPQQ